MQNRLSAANAPAAGSLQVASQPAMPAQDAGEVLAGVLALSSDAILSLDENQRITLFNRAAEEIFGYAAGEVLGKRVDLLLPHRFADRHRTEHVPGFALSAETSRPMAERMAVFGRRRNGEEFPAEVTIAVTTLGDRLRYTAVLRDITVRVRMDVAVLERQRRFRGIFDAAFQFIGLLAPDGVLLEANRTALDFIGRQREQVVGRPFWETPWWAHSVEQQQRLREAITAAGGGAFVRFETEHVGMNGESI